MCCLLNTLLYPHIYMPFAAEGLYLRDFSDPVIT